MAAPGVANYAFLLAPADDAVAAVVVDAAEEWSTDLAAGADADLVLWGGAPLRSPPAPAVLLRHVRLRERALRAVRAGTGGLRLHRVHRLAPPPGPPGRIAARVRDYLLGGALVELVGTRAPRNRLEAAAGEADVAVDWATFAPGSDRAGTARGRRGGTDVILRAGPSGTPSDPTAAAAALDALAAAGVGHVPRVLARGSVGSVAYACETVLAGRRPRRIDDDLLTQVAGWLAGLPRGRAATRSFEDDVAALQELLPAARDDLDRLAAATVRALAGVPSVMTHGDLWAGNLLVRRGRLVGVIDWDGARLDGVPGTDLLHLVVSQGRARAGGEIGAAWARRPWREERFLSLSAPYWQAFELEPEVAVLDAVGAAWWAGWLRNALERHERRLADAGWIAANVTEVLALLRNRL